MLDHFNLKGKIALVTGGAGLLGIEHSHAILEAGGTVVLADLDKARLAEAKNKLAEYYEEKSIFICRMDVTSEDDVSRQSDLLTNELGRIDILINNAAIDPKVKDEGGMVESSRLENFPMAQWELQIAVGLTGAFLCAKAFGSKMAQDDKGGVILNIASDLSVIAPNQSLYRREGVASNLQPVKPVTYSVIKTGLVGLTRYLSTYWADKNVRSNSLSPGGVFDGQASDFVQNLTNLIPLSRMANRDEYRGAVQFLCSDASSYMTGQNIVIDGGRSVW
ncbi:MAG: NAD(P)-dependent dehydrogenase (short-subunit alcohol dehydrogenase family) [Candidatus Azotimanducaceae bacterium]|jgi:NAD(P)-dependent dehydrogenase (short-subunit alcohol dehydrogenase family)